jgi:hypothetical protein
MKEDTLKRLSSAVEHVLKVQAMLVPIAGRGSKAARAWKLKFKNEPANSFAKVMAVDVAPRVEKLAGKSKQVTKDLEKLFKAAEEPGQYFDGREFRDRNRKLLDSSKAFERDAFNALAAIKGATYQGMFPESTNPEVKATVRAMTEYVTRFTAFKIALNRV